MILFKVIMKMNKIIMLLHVKVNVDDKIFIGDGL